MEKQTNKAEDLILTSINQIIRTIEMEETECKSFIATSDSPVHQEREKEKLEKLGYKKKTYVDLLICYGKTGIFDLKQFNMVCKMLFNKEAIEFAHQYLAAIQQTIEIDKQITNRLICLDAYKHQNNLKYTEQLERVVGTEMTTCIIQAMFGKHEKEKYLKLRDYMASELKIYNMLEFQKKSIESIWKKQFDNWSENHMVLQAHMHLYLMIQEDLLKHKKNYVNVQTTQYKKEMK